ncbi:hypothetical protein GALL_535310 [mine drainage metagenome]|uniref:Uncharacterized protein n=1 Tax=mine drainage metagenome TaxID=410659 RepID=A0A1J5PBP7_9ZZZZ
MIEHEAQRHGFRLWPRESLPEGGVFPGRDVQEIALISAQGVFWRAATKKVAERRLVGLGQGRGMGEDEGHFGAPGAVSWGILLSNCKDTDTSHSYDSMGYDGRDYQ